MGSLLDKGGDIGGNSMYAWAVEAQWGVVGADFLDGTEYAACQSFDRAKRVVDCCPSLAVLLVIHPERDRVGLHQYEEWCQIRYYDAILLAEGNVLYSKLDSAGPKVAFGYHVFIYLEQEEERSGNQVCCCLSKGRVWRVVVG
jgi:hypothetical protein